MFLFFLGGGSRRNFFLEYHQRQTNGQNLIKIGENLANVVEKNILIFIKIQSIVFPQQTNLQVWLNAKNHDFSYLLHAFCSKTHNFHTNLITIGVQLPFIVDMSGKKYFVNSRLQKSHCFLPVLLPDNPLLGLPLGFGDIEIDIYIPHMIQFHHRRLPRLELIKTFEKELLEF